MLAGWIVLCAGSGAALIDGAGRKLLLGVAYAELVLSRCCLVVATALPRPDPGRLPLPALGLHGAGRPGGQAAARRRAVGPAAGWPPGPRTRVRRADPVQTHRLLATATLGLIGLSLAAVAVLAPVPTDGPNAPASVYSQH